MSIDTVGTGTGFVFPSPIKGVIGIIDTDTGTRTAFMTRVIVAFIVTAVGIGNIHNARMRY